MTNRFTRRVFLKGAAGASLVAASPLLPKARARADADDAILLCVFLRGAVDGLNVVIPYEDSRYHDLRQRIAIGAPGAGDGKAIDLDGQFGLHPALSPLREAWTEGDLSFVHAVGSPHPTRSHFEAQSYMERGSLSATPRSGWLNRLGGDVAVESEGLALVSFGASVPVMMRGAAPSFTVDELRARPNRGRRRRMQLFREGVERLYPDAVDDGDALARAGRRAVQARQTLEHVAATAPNPQNGADYPRGQLGARLSDVAKVIKARVGLRIAYVDSGGWDTHQRQAGTLAHRLAELGGAFAAFRRDLGSRGEKVLVLAFSEFGRTVAENGSRGTDHGHGTAMILMGAPVGGGRVLGRWPGLGEDQLYEGRDLAVTTDFRDVFDEVARGHLGFTGDRLFPGFEATRPAPLGIFS